MTTQHRRLIALGAVSACLVLAGVIALVVGSSRPGSDNPAGSDSQPNAAAEIEFAFGSSSPAIAEINPEANPEPLASPTPSAEAVSPSGERPSQPPRPAPSEAKPALETPAPTAAKTSTKPTAPSAEVQPPPKPATPAPPTNPFEGFASAVSLPPVDKTDPKVLGTIRVPEHYICVLYLLGGEGLARGRHAFRCDYAQMGTAQRSWEIFARDTGVSAPEVLVANLTLAREQLTFAWTSDAAQCAAAGSLANCALKISAGRGVHTLALRRGKLVNAIPIKYEKTSITWELADTPRTERAQLEFLIASPKELPRPRFLGKSIVPANQAETWVEFGIKPEERYLKLFIEGQLNVRSLEVTVTPFIQLAGQSKPLAVTPDNLKKLEKSLAEAAAPGESRLRELAKSKTKGKAGSPEAKERDALNKQLAGIRLAQGQLRQFKALEGRFAKEVKLKVRAYHQADQAIVDLVQSR